MLRIVRPARFVARRGWLGFGRGRRLLRLRTLLGLLLSVSLSLSNPLLSTGARLLLRRRLLSGLGARRAERLLPLRCLLPRRLLLHLRAGLLLSGRLLGDAGAGLGVERLLLLGGPLLHLGPSLLLGRRLLGDARLRRRI